MADDLFQELEEEQRLAKMRSVGLCVGVVVLCVLIVAGIGGGVWGWKQHQLHTAQAQASNRYFEAMSLLGALSGKPVTEGAAHQKAEGILQDLAQSAPEGVRSYAAMYLAELKLQEHDTASALKLWSAVAEDKKADTSLRSMAQYRGLNARMDTAPRDELRAGYQALVQEGGSWVPLAKEGLAVLDLAPGSTKTDHEEARRLLQQVQSSPDSTEGLRQRAGMLLQTLGEAG